MKTVKLWSSTLLRGHKSINLSVLNSNKVAFVMHASQKVASTILDKTVEKIAYLGAFLLNFVADRFFPPPPSP